MYIYIYIYTYIDIDIDIDIYIYMDRRRGYELLLSWSPRGDRTEDSCDLSAHEHIDRRRGW